MQITEEKQLRPYIRDALDKFRNQYHKHSNQTPFNGRFVFPSGSGKTSLESFILRDKINQDGNRIHLVLAPRIILVNQLMREYRKFIGDKYIGLAFHSGRNEPDFEYVKWTENSTTNPKFAVEELNRAHDLDKDLVIFSTYHSAERLIPFNFDTLIADESQYCLYPEFFKVVKQINANVRLFFTAYEEQDNGSYNFNNKELFGDIIARGYIKDLIKKNYLVSPKLHIMTAIRKSSQDILTGVTKEMNSFISESIHIAKIQDKETRKTMPFSKILFACEGTDDVKTVTQRIVELNKEFPTHRIFTIVSNKDYGCMINGVKLSRDDFMFELKKDTNALIFHYDILSEGIDVDGITGVVIMRTMGKSKLLQTIGRSIRVYQPNPKLKREALISVPVINYDDRTKAIVKDTVIAMREGGYEVDVDDIVYNDERCIGINLEEELDVQYDLSRRKKAQTLIENVMHEIENAKYSSFEYDLKIRKGKDIANSINVTKTGIKYAELVIQELANNDRTDGFKGTNSFASYSDWSKSMKNIRITKYSTFGIFQNVEIIPMLIHRRNVDPSKIIFFGSCSLKKTIVEKFGVKYIDIKNTDMRNIDLDDYDLGNINQYTKFSYTFSYPTSRNRSAVMDMIYISRKLARNNSIMISENIVMFNNKKYNVLKNLSYYQTLKRKHFTKNYNKNGLTISMVYDVKGCNQTKVKIGDRLYNIDNFSLMPGYDNYQEWKYACGILDKKLPGLDIKKGALLTPIKNSKSNNTGFKIINAIGSENNKNYGTVLRCNNNQKSKAVGLGYHKILIPGRPGVGGIGTIKYAGPEYAVGGVIKFITVKDKNEAVEYMKYLKSPKVQKLTLGLKADIRDHSREILSRIPRLKYKDKWK